MLTFISGATGGLGKAYAKVCAKNNDDLFLTGRSEQKLLDLKLELLSSFPNVKIDYFACDLTSEIERNNLIDYCIKNNIFIERILNVAGVDIQKGFLDYTQEKLLFQIKVNSEATICLTHAFLTKMNSVKEILTISSMSGVSPMPYFAVYSATKSMLTNFFTSLHYELKGKVKVTTAIPGGIYTREDVKKDISGQGLWGKLSAKQPEFIVEKTLKALRKNKIKVIPGFFNRALYRVMKIAPKCIILKFIANRWKKQTKDAF